jgi:hypothetical protein
VKIDHLNAISPWIAKVAAERRLQFEFIFLSKFLFDFLELRFIANHDPEMAQICSLNFVDFENGEELMITQFEERIALAATYPFEIENILVKRYRLLNVIHLDRDMIASIDLHAHMSAYSEMIWRARQHFNPLVGRAVPCTPRGSVDERGARSEAPNCTAARCKLRHRSSGCVEPLILPIYAQPNIREH